MAQWGKMQVSWRTHPDTAGAEPLDRATWVWLWVYSCEHEIGGRIAGCRSWGDRRWQQLAQVTAEEVAGLVERTGLARWDGDDLVVSFCDGQLDQRTVTSKANGTRGGRPKKTKPKTYQEPNSKTYQEPNADTEKRREEKTRLDKRRESSALAEDSAHTKTDLTSASPDIPPRLMETWREIAQQDGVETANRALAAGRRIFRAPSPAQLLETWKHAAEAGMLDHPPDRWPDFRDRIKADRRRERNASAIEPDADDLAYAANLEGRR